MRIGWIMAAIAVSGCAASASGIDPIRPPAAAIAALDCAQVETQLATTDALVADLSRRQDTAARRDVAGVALIGLPVGSLFRGNVREQLAHAKGQQEALREEMQGRCARRT